VPKTFLRFRVLSLGILVLAFAFAGHAQRVTATLSAGTAPQAIAVNPVTNKIYVANAGSNTVTVIDGATNIRATVNVGTSPQAIAVNPATNKVYVANHGSSNVTVINGADNSTASVSVGNGPQAIAVNTVTNEIYVANQTSNTVSVISGFDNSTLPPVSTGAGPTAIAVNASSNKIYVANAGDNNVTVIDAVDDLNTTTTVAAGTQPFAIAVNQVTNKIYVANRGSNNVTVINGTNNSPSTVTDATAKAPSAVAINPVSNRIYVANQTSNGVTVIDGSNDTVATTTGAGTAPVAIAVDAITNMIYVADASSKNVTVIDGSNNNFTTLTDANGNSPQAVAANPVTNKIYVANQTSNNVTVIDGATNSTAFLSPLGAGEVVVNPVTNRIYVSVGSSVIVLDGVSNNVIANINVSVGGLIVNPLTNKIYGVHGLSLVVIDGATNTATTVPVETLRPVAFIAVNPLTNRIYAFESSTFPGITVIDGATNQIVTSQVMFEFANSLFVNPLTNEIYVSGVFGGLAIFDGNLNLKLSLSGANAVMAMNPVTNILYARGGTGVSVIDGNTDSIITTITLVGGIGGMAVNPVNNKLYVESSNTVVVIDGASNTVITTLPTGMNPGYIAVNPVTNKVYVANGDNTVTVIDGTSNSTTSLAVNGQFLLPAINPLDNQIYIGNSNGSPVVVTEQQVNAIPLTTTITPFSNNQVAFPAPTVVFTTHSAYAPNAPPGQNVLYQLDTWQGPWLPATQSAPSSFRADLPVLRPGTHTLYAYATDSQQGDSIQTGNGSNGQSSPVIGQIAAYAFTVVRTSFSPVATLSSNVNASFLNQPVTLTATISSTMGLPTNSVSFYENYPSGPLLGSAPVSSGTATLTISNLSVGQHPITAVYSGDAIFSPAVTNTLYQVVNKGLTQTALSLSTGTNPSLAGTSLTFTAMLSTQFGGAPTGSMTFMDGNTTLGTGTPGGPGVWTFATSSLTAGGHSITAVYSGDGNFATSTSAVFNQVVESNAGGASTAALTVNGATGTVTINFGVAQGVLPAQAANLVVTVTGGSDGDAVVLLDGNRQLGPALTLTGGQASYTSQLPVGQHNLQAVYVGNGSVGGSASAVVSVERSPRPRPR